MRLMRALPLAVVSLLISAAANGLAPDAAFVPWKIHRAGEVLPAAPLVDAWGVVVGRVAGSKGSLRASDVEKMMRDAMRAREESLNADLDNAPKKISAGDRDLAVAIYRRVWMHRCVFPRHGREA